MAQKWNLQDIKPAPKRKPMDPAKSGGVVKKTPTVTTEKEDIPRITIENGNEKKRSKTLLAIITFVTIVGGGFILSAFMSGAELTVHPLYREPNVNATFTAYPEPRSNELSYEIMILKNDSERQVTASGEEVVEELAQGEIEIRKTSPGAERLIKNTRFQSPNGLIYRIQESVVVPGSVTDGDGNSLPGTIRAQVFAENAGEEYNLPANTKFTIPGFAENNFDELFQNITAVNPNDFTGGFSGSKFIIDEGELATARQALQVDLRNSLLGRIDEEKPAGMVVYETAVAITYNQLPAVEYEDELVTIKEEAVLQIPMFKEDEFASFIAAATVPGYEGNPVRIDDPNAFVFTYTNATTSNSVIANAPSIEFNLKGRPLIVWTYDEDKLKADLLGVPKTALSNILAAYPAIESANAVVRPFWKRSFPTEASEITVTEELKQSP